MEAVSRICLIGPESTGKSELAAKLAARYGTVWVPEFARAHALERGSPLTVDGVEVIARGQMAAEDKASADEMVILDTDLISTVVYSRHYYGHCPDWIMDEARRRRADLYLLMDTDIAWKADAARDAEGDVREDLFDAFRAALDEFDTRWVIVSGEGEGREEAAVRAIDATLDR